MTGNPASIMQWHIEEIENRKTPAATQPSIESSKTPASAQRSFESNSGKKSSSHRGALRGLDLNAIIPSTQPARLKSLSFDQTDDDDDAPPATQHTTRASRNGRAKVNYSAKYHPMDEVTRPANAAKRDIKSEPRRWDLTDDDEDNDDEDDVPTSTARTTRGARNGRAKVNYNMKYHPMDEVTRPVHAAKQHHRDNARSKRKIVEDSDDTEDSNDAVKSESDDDAEAAGEVIEILSGEDVDENPPETNSPAWQKHALRYQAKGFPRPRKSASLERSVAAVDDGDGPSLVQTPVPGKRARKRLRSIDQNNQPPKSAKTAKSVQKKRKVEPQPSDLERMPYGQDDDDGFQAGADNFPPLISPKSSIQPPTLPSLVIIRPYYRPSLATKLGLTVVKPYVKATSIVSAGEHDMDGVLQSVFGEPKSIKDKVASNTSNTGLSRTHTTSSNAALPQNVQGEAINPWTTSEIGDLQDEVPNQVHSHNDVSESSKTSSKTLDHLPPQAPAEPPSSFEEHLAVTETQHYADTKIATEEFGH